VRLAVGALAVACLLTACSGDDPDPPPPPRSLPWTQIALPPGLTWTELAATSRGMLVAGDAHGSSAPAVDRLTAGGAVPLGVRPASYYGRRGEWRGFTATGDGARTYGFTGRSGGAHGNVRWSAWSSQAGSPDSVGEDPQDFETFGGPNAGGLVAIALPGGEPVVVGSWASAATGLDIALWRLSGRTWTRSAPAEALRTTAAEQLSVRGATELGENGLMITGAVTRFDDGHVRLVPAVWTAPSPDGPWQRAELPADSPLGQAVSASCTSDGRTCWVVGEVDDTATVWRVTVDASGAAHAVRQKGIPALPVTVTESMPAPLLVGDIPVVVLRKGTGSLLLQSSGSGWQSAQGPPCTPRDTAELDGRFYVLGTGSTGESALWSLTADAG
jgi:hypothetical protein